MKKFFKRVHAKQAGFTLIELLVVIAIIGILAAIIVPNVSKYISTGTTAASESETKIVQNAVMAAMASAKVPTCPTGTINKTTDFDVKTGSTTTITNPGTTKAGYYLSGTVAALKGAYNVLADGTVQSTGYTP